jgi:phage repressor protein C with HTH and peptisase S24 domain
MPPISITNENYPYINSPVTVRNENHPSINMPVNITNENSPAINVPVTVTNENYPSNKLSFSPPSPDIRIEKELENAEKDYENRTDDEGYLVIHSVPIYKGYARAGKSGEPEPVLSKDQFAEFHQVNIEDKLYTIHSLRKSNRVNVPKEGNWGWIKVKGESMNALAGKVHINDGDYVLFQKNSNADDNDIVIAVNKDNHSTHVKRFRKFEKTLYSESTDKTSDKYAPIDMEENNMEIVGIVYAVANLIP